jgi:Ca2+-binding RTX toxin-like protein
MRRAVSVGTIAVMLVLATAAYAAFVRCDGGRCEGTNGDDEIVGSRQADAIYTLDGFDFVEANPGHDYVSGGEGADTILGEKGSDTLYGHKLGDSLEGGAGNDILYGGPDSGTDFSTLAEDLDDRDGSGDRDTAYGGPGWEFIRVEDGDGKDYVNCGADSGGGTADRGDEIENCDPFHVR